MRGNPFQVGSPRCNQSSPLPYQGLRATTVPDTTRNTNEDSARFVVTSDLLIPGKGDPIPHGCIVVQANRILHVGRTNDLSQTTTAFSQLPCTHVKVLMPGLWDCHVHLTGMHTVTGSAFISSQQNMALTGARLAKDAQLLLDAGFTSVREMAGYGIQLASAIEEGSAVGPTIYSSNSIISPTGGHADLHTMPTSWFEDACAHGLPMRTCDGVAECLKAVREQLRAGAQVIKICGSGGVGSERDNPVDQQFSSDEMRVMVEEATRAQRLVGAHCHGKAGIMAALHAGVKTIEHGSYLDAEAAQLMKDKGAVLVATRLIVENGLALGEGLLSPAGYAKLLAVAENQWEAMRLAIRTGVTCAIGTDSCGTVPGSNLIRQGLNGKELFYHVQAGMTPLQAIEAATANAPLTLGPQAPKSGQLREGYEADFIGLDADPLQDIRVLSGPGHVSHVWKQGRCWKSPGRPLSCLDT